MIKNKNRNKPKLIELMNIVRKKQSITSFLSNNNLINENNEVNIKSLLIDTLESSKNNISHRIKNYAELSGISYEFFRIEKKGNSLEYHLKLNHACMLAKTYALKFLVQGNGINDYEGHVSIEKRDIQSYSKWVGMLERCYNPIQHAKTPSYKDCYVSEDWIYYSNFKRWFDENYTEGDELDKDIISRNNKLYSAETCLLVPSFINLLFVSTGKTRGKFPIGTYYHKRDDIFCAKISKNRNGVNKRIEIGRYKTPTQAFLAYKREKESYIKEIAEEYFENNLICKKTYEAMHAYDIKIDD